MKETRRKRTVEKRRERRKLGWKDKKEKGEGERKI
jgi:hypothetical protein